MSRRHDIERQRSSLGEIREIMSAMKSLAYMETQKLSALLSAQQLVIENMDAAATDFLSFYGDQLNPAQPLTRVYLLIGTERGFCGDINQRLLAHLESLLKRDVQNLQQSSACTSPKLIAIGHKMHSLLQDDDRVAAFLDGANVAEDITRILPDLIESLETLQRKFGAVQLYGIFQGDKEAVVRQLLPCFPLDDSQPVAYGSPPLLNLSVEDLFLELSQQYLFAAINEMLNRSLMNECLHRVAHLEGAVRHLDEQSQQLLRRANTLRQEEITEEIEVILLSAGGFVSTTEKKRS